MTEYRRCQGKSYMVISLNAKAEGYEYSMLAENKIAGFLPLWTSGADGQTQFWYEISGRRSLDDRIKMKKPDSAFLKRWVASLMSAVCQAGECLLNEDGISLDPNRIFLDTGEKEFLFCYMPFAKTPFAESIRNFMEYFISNMEHGDRDSARRCYDVYEKCQQDHPSLEEIVRILYEEETKQDVKGDACQELEAEHAVTDERPKEEPERKKISQMQFVLAWLRKRRMLLKKRDMTEPYVFEPKERMEESVNPTVFLGSETKQILGELRYEGEGDARNLPITSPVFLIGSRAKEANGVIFSETVSRIHAKITKEEDGYYLEDMNSTNGTYHNGELLNYKEKVLLAKNDKISFANERYRFV